MGEHVFISHANADKQRAYELCQRLENTHGVRCWMAPDDIPRGMNFAEAIVDAIERSRVFLLVFSKHTNASRYVEREVRTAADADSTIIPFRLDDEPMSNTIAFFLGHHQWVDASKGVFDDKVDEVAESIAALGGTGAPRDRGAAPARRVRSRGGRKPLWIAALALLLVGGALAIWATRGAPHDDALEEAARAGDARAWDRAGAALARARELGATDEDIPRWLRSGVEAWNRPPALEIQKPNDRAEQAGGSVSIWGTLKNVRVGDTLHVLANGDEAAQQDLDEKTAAFHHDVPLPTIGPYELRIEIRRAGNVLVSATRAIERTTSIPASCVLSDAQRALAHERRVPAFFENDIGMWFVLLPPGKAALGAAPDSGADPDETPREVELRNVIYIQVGEVSNAQFRRFDPSHRSGKVGSIALDGADHPAVRISHKRARQFAKWLSQMDRKRTYRLPTEAEWEYAARAGGAGHYVDELRTEPGKYANFGDSGTAAVFPAWKLTPGHDDGIVGPAGRDAMPANPWALRNVMGNAAEWCSDWYGPVAEGLHLEPIGPAEGHVRVIRGGSWASEQHEMRVSNRFWFPENLGDPFVGFRLVVTVE